MWSDTFLEDEKWEKIRNSMDRPVIESWNKLSEKTKRAIVTQCAQRLSEEESTSGGKTIDPLFREIKLGKAFQPETGPDDIPETLPKPNPISENIVPIERADPGIPGDIVVDENGKLLKRYLGFTNFTRFLTESYDGWIWNGLLPMIKKQKIKVRGGAICFKNVSLTPPKTAKGEKIYPRQARHLGITYGLRIHTDVFIEKYDTDGVTVISEEKLGEKKELGEIPLMLNSKLCYLYKKTPKELMNVQEDPADPFGYFIVSGAEKVILLQEKLRLNRIFVTSSKKGTECSLTVETARGTVRINLVFSRHKRINFETRFKAEINSRRRTKSTSNESTSEEREEEVRRRAQAKISASKKDGNYRYIGVEKLFYILQIREGHTPDPNLMAEQITRFTKKEWRSKVNAEISILKFLFPSEEVPMLVERDIAQIKGGIDVKTPENITSVVNGIIDNELFPQLNTLKNKAGLQNIYALKNNMLAMMVARLIEVNIGLSPPDDRDSWSNKRLETASRSMDQLMKSIWRRFVANIKNEMEDKHISKHKSDIVKLIDQSNITRFFESSFIGPNWGVPGSIKNNMTQTPNRESVVALYSHMTRIDVATNRNDKQPSIRMVHGTQYGYVCVTGDTQISINQHHTQSIRELQNGDTVLTVSKDDLCEIPSRIKNYFKTQPKKLLELTTISGRTIKCTPDHPFLVVNSGNKTWVRAGKLQVSDQVIIKHILEPINDEKVTKLYIESKDISELYRDELMEMGLLDRYLPQQYTETLARLLGASITDGHVHRRNNGSYYSSFYLGEKADVFEIVDDILSLGFSYPNIRRKISKCDNCVHKTWEVTKNGAFACLMVSIGAFIGKKTHQHRIVPIWIKNANLKTLRAFLSGFQGGDGGKISVYSNVNKWKISIGPTHQFSSDTYFSETKQFLEEIRELFSRFKIMTEVKYNSLHDNLFDLRLVFRGDLQNIITYANQITYSYCYEKRRKSAIAIEYAKYKYMAVTKRQEAYDKAYSMFGEHSISEISTITGISPKQLSRLKRNALNGKIIKARCPNDFIGYNKFTSEYKDLEDKISIPIKSIKEIDAESVYDFETVNTNHSFIANGFVTHNCPVESPEGENCGIVKNLAVTAQITYAKSDANVIEEILTARSDVGMPLFSENITSTHNTAILVNGKFLGWCIGIELRRHLVMFRRSSWANNDMGITLDTRNNLFVHTDTSRLVRPLLVVEPVEKKDGKIEYEPLIKTKNLMGADIRTLFEEGVIEYVDSYEVESPYLLVAKSFDQVKERYEQEKTYLDLQKETLKDKKRKESLLRRNPDNKRIQEEVKEIKNRLRNIEETLNSIRDQQHFTHVEMDSTAILGISASIIPYPNHNQGPRNSYQSSMYKQALGIARSHHMACYSGKHKVLAYPTRPLFEPQLNEVLNLNAFPQGEMVWVAFATTTGFTQEDAIVFNRASIDMGKFRMFKYINHRVTIGKSDGGRVEKLKLPSTISIEQRQTIYEHLNEDGLPIIGAHIKQRQAIIGKVIMDGAEEIANESILLGYGEEGIVDRVIVTSNGVERIVFVSLRVLRIPIEGDKFAPRNAQKATIGKVLPPEDMPYTEEGIIPDIIVNPHAIPSRMTHSYMMELIASKAGAIVGERINATAFRPFDYKYFRQILRDYGFSPDGKHVMYSGTTGRKINTRIFTGPCYVQALRHHVQDKIQVRRTGPRSATSRQPVKGRALMGGLRFGEMERDAAIAHGAAYFLKERLCGVSDCYKAVYCKCGQIATKSVIDGGYTCKLCRGAAEFGEVETTAALKLLSNILAGSGFKQVFNFETEEQQRERMEKEGYLSHKK